MERGTFYLIVKKGKVQQVYMVMFCRPDGTWVCAARCETAEIVPLCSAMTLGGPA